VLHPGFEPKWSEQFIPLESIIKHKPFQMRKALDAAAVRRCVEMTAAGRVAPLIEVARIGSAHYLLSGWHRMEAGALTMTADDRVLVRIAAMTSNQALWIAAKANEDHGVQLKASDRRRFFSAFIKSGQHKLPKGGLMTYREMGIAVAKPHTTIRNWVKQDFPRLFRTLQAEGTGNLSPGMPPSGRVSLDEERISQAHEAARTLQQIGDVLTTAEARGDLMRILQETLASLQGSGKPIIVGDF
jgi:hypothetical protein